MATTTELITSILDPLTVNTTKRDMYIEKWQMLLYDAAELTEEEAIVDANWPYLFRLLMAYAVIKDLVLDSINRQTLAGADGSAIGSGPSSSGNVKKIETGPVNVERFDPIDSASSLYKAIFAKDGLWEAYNAQICGIASRLKLYMPDCKSQIPITPQVLRASDYAYEDQQPITPATVRK